MILITGANGVVGKPLVSRLVDSETPYICISRYPSDGQIEWNLTREVSPQSLKQLSGCRELFHCAPIWLLPRNLPTLKELGIRRIVVFSSTSIISKQVSENSEEQSLVKQLSKAEVEIKHFCTKAGVDYTILRPSMIYGYARDQNVSHIALFIKKRGFMVLVGGAYGLRQPVHADDLVEAAVAVLGNTVTHGETYNLAGGEVLSYRKMVIRIFEGLNKKPRIVNVPLWLFRFALRIARLLNRFDYTPEMADRMNQDLCYSTLEAERDFLFSPQPFLIDSKRDLP